MKRRLLLVEDNPDDQYLVIRALRDFAALEIEVASDGQEAYDYLFVERLPQPDLILLDLKMPRMSGLELLRSIRETPDTSSIPIVVFSSSDEPAEVAQVTKLKAEYIQKPVDFDQHTKTLKDLITRLLNPS